MASEMRDLNAALKAFAAATSVTDVTPEGVNADMGNYSGYKAAGGTYRNCGIFVNCGTPSQRSCGMK